MYARMSRIPLPWSESAVPNALFSDCFGLNPFPSSLTAMNNAPGLSRPTTNVHSIGWILPVAVNDCVPYDFSERQLHALFFAGNTFGLGGHTHQSVDARRNRFDLARYAPADV
jgi:hypothetical protein